MKRVYQVRLHEVDYYGSLDMGAVATLIVQAKSSAQAETKALKWAKAQDYTPCRVSSCVETRFDEVIA